MNETGIFRLIWRFNAIGIAVAVVLGILLSLFALYMIIAGVSGERHVRNIVNVENNISVKQHYQLGAPSLVNGHNILSMPLYFGQKYNQSYYSKGSSGNIVNYAFFNSASKEATWLFDHTKFLILKRHTLPTRTWEKKENVVEAFIYSLIKEDTNNDGRLTASDMVTVSISSPDGKSYTELLHGIKNLTGVEQTGEDEIALVFENNEGAYLALVSTDTHQISYKKALSIGEAKESE